MIPSRILAMADAALVAAILSTSTGTVAAQQPPALPASAAAPAGNIENGARVFVKYGCSQCHGLEGQGAPTSGPRIGPSPIPLAGFLAYVRSPRVQMPPYTAKVVSDQELTDIRAFLAVRSGPVSQTLLQPE